MQKLCGVVLAAILAFLPFSATAQVQKLEVRGVVVSVLDDGTEGDHITISLGKLQQLKERMTGDIFFEIRFPDGSVTANVIGSFDLRRVGSQDSDAIITDIRQAGVRIRAKQHLVRITHNVLSYQKGKLEVRSPLAGTDVLVDQKSIGKTPLKYELPCDIYSVSIPETLYHKAAVQEVVILPNETTSWDAYPLPKKVKLVVTSEPSGAYVSLIKQKKPTERMLALPRKETICEFDDLDAGQYEMLVEAIDGYYPWSRTVEVVEDPTEKHVKLDKHAVLTIDVITDGSVNKNATVVVNGPEGEGKEEIHKFSPVELIGLPPGAYTITASVPDRDFAPGTEDVEIKPGMKRHLTIELPRVKVTIEIRTDPEGMIVILDGQVRGKTPITLKEETGEHKLRLELDGIQRERPVVFDHEAEPIVEIFKPGIIMVESFPKGAEIYVDNETGARELTDGKITLPVGQHTITLKKSGR